MMGNNVLRIFVIGVVAIATVALISLSPTEVVENPWVVVLLVALTALVGARPVRIAALRTEIVAIHPFVLCALATVGPMAAGLAAIGGVVAAMLANKRKLTTIRFTFNIGGQVLSAVAAGGVFLLLGGIPGGKVLEVIGPLAAGTAAYFVLNTGLVAGVIAIEKRQPFLKTWLGTFSWTTSSYFTGLTLAAAMILLLDRVGPLGLALGVPPTWLLAAFYRNYKEKLEEQQKRIEEIEAHNVDLEKKVADRTYELQETLDQLEDANDQLRETNDQLIKANQAKSDFLANMSHELRTPLNAIIGFSDLLADGSFGALKTQQAEFVSDIRDSGESLLEMINDLLDLSKIEAGKMEVNLRDVAVPDVVRDAAGMMRALAVKKHLDLSIRIDETLGRGRIDPGMLRQILVNLLSNALKFTPEGGRVIVSAVRKNRDLSVSVTDNGIGIPNEMQSKIFQAFDQVDGSYARKYQGTGLGLALVRRMTGLHGGIVTVESEPGSGSSFTCLFPGCLVDEPRPETPGVPVVEPATGFTAQRTVLIVEDNPLNRKLARNALRSRKHRVLEAATSEEALELARSHRPDLILMDLQMPGLDGLEVTRRLKTDAATAALQVVAMSASARPEDRDEAIAAGCCGYISKPIRLSRFPAQVDSYFSDTEVVA
jgi:signal transduction histidine kinase/CheY-like chemotaxis protein